MVAPQPPPPPPPKASTLKSTMWPPARFRTPERSNLPDAAKNQSKNDMGNSRGEAVSEYVRTEDKLTSRGLADTRNSVHDELREVLRRRDSELRSTREERDTLCNTFKQLDKKMQRLESDKRLLQNEARDLQNRYDQEVKSNKANAQSIHKLSECKDVVEKELVELQKKYAIQKGELRDCRDDLFDLQPVVQRADSDILIQYNRLCEQISNWVDNEISVFESGFQSCMNPPSAIINGHSAEIKRFLQEFPDGGEDLVGALIHRFLHTSLILLKRRPHGFPEREGEWIDQVGAEMAKRETKKDPLSIRRWRCDTFQAALMVQSIADTRNRAIEKAAGELFQELRFVFPGLASEGLPRLLKEVIRPAAELEASICVSHTEYSFSPTDDVLIPQYGPMTQKEAARYTLIDVGSGRTIRTSMTSNSDGFVGHPLLCLEPGLSRAGRDGNLIEVRKSKYLFNPYMLPFRHD